MSVEGGPNIVNSSLGLCVDAGVPRSYPGDTTNNLSYNNGQGGSEYLAASIAWTNSGTWTLNTNNTTIDKPTIVDIPNLPSLPTNLRVISGVTDTVGSQHHGCGFTYVNASTTYTMSVWFRQNRAGVSAPYLRTNINNNQIGTFSYNGSTNSANWPVNQWIRISATGTTQSNENGIYLSDYIGTQVGDATYFYGHQVEVGSTMTALVAGTRTASLLDTSGNSYNFTLEGTVNYSSDFGGTLRLNTGRVYRTNLGWYGNYTISFWVKMMSVMNGNFYTENYRGAGGCARIYSTMNSNGTFTYAGWDNSSGGLSGGAGRSVTTTSNVQDGNWHQICCVWSNGSSNRTRGFYVFVDGVQEAYQDAVGNDGGYESMHIGGATGCVGTTASNCYLGQILQYNNVALSNASILQNYQALKGRYT